ncbi:MAG: serine/threonine-protein phosphatase [Clostridiales bacterium]|jgi:serine/threonine protein phosphatase PrpC|nr:serine/threonine-protein phosphatase [Clostridiales bacterium]
MASSFSIEETMTDIFGISKKGGRTYNQDCAAQMTVNGKTAVVVCDGLGAYAGSDIAGEIAIDRVLKQLKKDIIKGEDVLSPVALTKAVKAAHNAILKGKGFKGDFIEGCTTIALVVTDGKGAAIATLGDTRVYYFKNGKLGFQSRDHSLAQAAVDRGEIKREEIRYHSGQNKLTKVIGSDVFSPPDIHIISGPLSDGDLLMIASDGFWEYVFESEMAQAAGRGLDARTLVEGLETLLLGRVDGRNDNYTAVALAFGAPKTPAAQADAGNIRVWEADEQSPAQADAEPTGRP